MRLPEYNVRHSAKARNIRLKVTPEDGLVVVVPRGYDEGRIPAILNRKKTWIADALAHATQTRRFLEPKPSTYLPERLSLQAISETWAVTCCQNRTRHGIGLRAADGTITITGRAVTRDDAVRKLNDWLRLRVRDSLFPLAQSLADKHRLPIRRLMVKSQRTRWASCSAKKNLALNTKLLFLPPDLVRYVLIHELCHLREMSHSRRFWLHVQSACPDYRTLDARLRDAWKTVPSWVGASKNLQEPTNARGHEERNTFAQQQHQRTALCAAADAERSAVLAKRRVSTLDEVKGLKE